MTANIVDAFSAVKGVGTLSFAEAFSVRSRRVQAHSSALLLIGWRSRVGAMAVLRSGWLSLG